MVIEDTSEIKRITIMKLGCFIIPYFGKFPIMFPVFLKTCGIIQNFDWLLFTDIEDDYDYPQNVRVIKMTFEELKGRIQGKFDFNIVINEPHKLCDYKPAYGYIFEEYLSGYKFWGHCDIDTIMGDLDGLLDEKFISDYDKIFCLGHMILYKNNFENNRVFMSEYRGRSLYRESFSSYLTTVFDETFRGKDNIHTLFAESGKKIFDEDWSANFLIRPSRFIRTRYDAKTDSFINEDTKTEYLYVWDSGHIYRYWMKEDVLCKEELLYIHFQLRNMTYDKCILAENVFKAIPEKFEILEVATVSKTNFKKIKKRHLTMHYFFMKKHNLKEKIKKKNGKTYEH